MLYSINAVKACIYFYNLHSFIVKSREYFDELKLGFTVLPAQLVSIECHHIDNFSSSFNFFLRCVFDSLFLLGIQGHWSDFFGETRPISCFVEPCLLVKVSVLAPFFEKGWPHAGQHGAKGKMDMGEYPHVI